MLVFWEIKSKVVEKLQTNDTIDCCFAGHQELVLEYLENFSGHFFEKVIYSMFFDPEQNRSYEQMWLLGTK